MNIALGTTTHWVASAMEGQYNFAVAHGSLDQYTSTDNGTSVTVRNEHHEYQLQKDSWMCDCEFAITMKLPCRHSMLLKKFIRSAFTMPLLAIPARFDQMVWAESKFGGRHRGTCDSLIAMVFKADRNNEIVPLSEGEKYRRAQQAFGKISGTITSIIRFAAKFLI
ncbi:Zinc finger, SWIM-type [Phytophthora cactorum]|nr:Zinc finger, SWIM-type [Phytophthora cactorum]